MINWMRRKLDGKILQVRSELSAMQQTVRREEVVLRSHVGRYMGEHVDHNHGVLARLSAKLNLFEAWRRLLGQKCTNQNRRENLAAAFLFRFGRHHA